MIYRIRVAAIVLQEQKILLVKPVHPKTGFEWWVPPGGGLEELDRNIHDCAIRETWEETGYNIETNEIIYIREFVDFSTSPTGSNNHLASSRFQNTFRLNV